MSDTQDLFLGDISDLEEEYTSLFIKRITISLDSSQNDILRFVKNVQEEKRILMDFKESIITEWSTLGIGSAEWLPYYKMRLIQEIRDIKLNKLC